MTHVVAVSTTTQRDTLIANLIKNIEEQNQEENIEVFKCSLNKIQIYHKSAPDIRTLIKTILVVVIQVHINLEPLKNVYDDTILFDLHEVFKAIDCYKDKLNKIKNITSKRRLDSEKYTRLAESLSDTSGQY